MQIARFTRLTSVRVAAAFIIILAAGVGAGRLLLQYEQSLGFLEEADRIAEALQLRPGIIVADVRAGSGVWTVDIARRIGETAQVSGQWRQHTRQPDQDRGRRPPDAD